MPLTKRLSFNQGASAEVDTRVGSSRLFLCVIKLVVARYRRSAFGIYNFIAAQIWMLPAKHSSSRRVIGAEFAHRLAQSKAIKFFTFRRRASDKSDGKFT